MALSSSVTQHQTVYMQHKAIMLAIASTCTQVKRLSIPDFIPVWAITMHNERRTAKLPWHVGDLDLSAVDTSHLRENDDIFLLVCSASFVESGTATYAHNLAEYFADDAEIGEWLREHWEPEELQHGLALKAYVQHVWPEFDWDAAYAGFFTQYKKLC